VGGKGYPDSRTKTDQVTEQVANAVPRTAQPRSGAMLVLFQVEDHALGSMDIVKRCNELNWKQQNLGELTLTLKNRGS
jgi:hypothetical protein